MILGTIWRNFGVNRDGKNGVPMSQMPHKIFAANVCPGSGYLLTADAVPKLKDAISKVLSIFDSTLLKYELHKAFKKL